MIRFTAADRARAIQERSLEDFAKRSYKPVAEPSKTLHDAEPVRERNAFEQWFFGSGLTVKAAAARLGVSRPTIYAWRQKGAPDAVMAKLGAQP